MFAQGRGRQAHGLDGHAKADHQEQFATLLIVLLRSNPKGKTNSSPATQHRAAVPIGRRSP
jgi:hypothetical protein